MKQDSYEFVCHCCYAKVKEFGWLFKDVYFAKIEDNFCLIAGQGHRDDIIFSFGPAIVKDPYLGLSDDQIDAMPKEDLRHKQFVDFYNYCSELSKQYIHPYSMIGLYEDAKSKGYDLENSGDFIQWLVQ